VTLIERRFRERIILVGVVFPWTTAEVVDSDLDELALLVGTAGADVVGRVVQRRDHPDPATYVGRGKAEELHELSLTVDSDTVVFDDELSPAQQRNLEKILGRTAIDRTAVILDIFAQNARSLEGKAQVELALLRYRLPRLRGRGREFSQQAGGIGTRGPGETQLEVDRRRLLRRMARLEVDLRQVSATRRTQRRSRVRGRHRSVSLVGYTNAGKSTLLNRLTDAGVLVESRPFSTLDPRTRRLALPGGETVLLSDTVGFVRKLPHQLVEAFRSTLDEVREAELLLHVVDGSVPEPEAQIDAVRLVLEEIGAGDVPELLVVNKADRGGRAQRVAEDHPGAVVVSARTGLGIDELIHALGVHPRVADRVVELLVPFDRGDVLAAVHREGEVVDEAHGEGATVVHVVLDEAGRARFQQFLAS
jgi:GTP-binding protein HflX